MTTELERKIDDIIASLTRILTIEASLSVAFTSGQSITRLLANQQAIMETVFRDKAANVQALHWSEGELYCIYCSGHASAASFLLGAVDALARQAVLEADSGLFSLDFDISALKLVGRYGIVAAELLTGCAKGVLVAARHMHHAWLSSGEADDDVLHGRRWIAIDDPDDANQIDEDWGLSEIPVTDPAARPTTYADCNDLDGWAELIALISERDGAARAVLRGDAA